MKRFTRCRGIKLALLFLVTQGTWLAKKGSGQVQALDPNELLRNLAVAVQTVFRGRKHHDMLLPALDLTDVTKMTKKEEEEKEEGEEDCEDIKNGAKEEEDVITQTTCGFCYESFRKPEDIVACAHHHKAHIHCLNKWRVQQGRSHCPYCMEVIRIHGVDEARNFYQQSIEHVREWKAEEIRLSTVLQLIQEGPEKQRQWQAIPHLSDVDQRQLESLHVRWKKVLALKIGSLKIELLNGLAFLAIRHDCEECFEIVSSQPRFDINVKAACGHYTLLLWAILWDRMSIVDHILHDSKLRNINEFSGRVIQWNPLHLAISMENEMVVKKLLVHPLLDLNVKCMIYSTPLHHSLFASNLAIFELLMSDPRTDLGKTDVNLRIFAKRNPRVHARILEMLPDDYNPPVRPTMRHSTTRMLL